MLFGCASDSSRDSPNVALSSGVFAQSEFRALRTRFFDADAKGRAALEKPLESYLARHSNDERSAQVKVFLAWACLERGERERARLLLEPVLAGPRGATRDFARVASAALFAREGKTKRALDVFAELEGRIVDLDERFVYGEERTRAAFAAGDLQPAFYALLTWLAQSPPDRLVRGRTTAKSLLDMVPASDLALGLRGLARPDAERPTNPELESSRVWLVSTVVERLTRLAIERSDEKLARRVLDVSPAALRACRWSRA